MTEDSMNEKKLSVEILQFISQNPRSSPLFIARNLGRRPGLIRNHLVVLTELKLIEAPIRGNYLIKRLGSYILKSLTRERHTSP